MHHDEHHVPYCYQFLFSFLLLLFITFVLGLLQVALNSFINLLKITHPEPNIGIKVVCGVLHLQHDGVWKSYSSQER